MNLLLVNKQHVIIIKQLASNTTSPQKMSKQKQPPKQKPATTELPQCINKKQAKLVCLNPSCSSHAFFCTNCQNDQCEVAHHHGDKLLSVSFKEYVKRVLKDKHIEDELEDALNRYAQYLEKLKRDVEEFVEKEMQELQEIKKKVQDVGQDEERVIQKLRKKEYDDLNGSDLDKLWQKIIQLQKRDNKDTIQFLSIKQQQIKQISDNFQKVNKMQLEDYADDDNEKNTESRRDQQSKMSKNSNVSNPNTKKQSNSAMTNKNSSAGTKKK